MLFRHAYRDGVWIDLEQPTPDELHQVAQEFSLSERFEKELVSPTPVPLVLREEDTLLLVLHFPSHGSDDGVTENHEVDFVVGKDFIVTVRYQVIAPLHHLRRLLETQAAVGKRVPVTTALMVEILFAHLYTAVRDHTNHVVDRISRIEREMFEGNYRATIRAILEVSREFLHMETAIADHEEPLNRFLALLAEPSLFGPSFVENGKRTLAERSFVSRLVKTHRAAAIELRETNIALVESRQNNIMKTLTVITFIFMPLELMVLMFSMHLPGTPVIEESPHAFWIAIATLATVGLVMTGLVARKRWFA